MKQQDVISFFNSQAPNWDAEMICAEETVHAILKHALLKEGADVLDVACGTGVLFPFYLRRRAASVTAIDVSQAMAEIARKKAGGLPIEVICGDAQTYPFKKRFDAIVIYNALPHFPEPQKLLAELAGYLHPGGTLTVAHGMGRRDIAKCHTGSVSAVSLELPPARVVADWIEPYCTLTAITDTDTMYQVTGILREDIKK